MIAWIAAIIFCASCLGAVFLYRRRASLTTPAERLRWGAPAIGILCAVVLVIRDGDSARTAATALMPAGLFWLLLIALSIWQWFDGLRRFAIPLAVCTLLYTVLGNPWVGGWLIAQLESDHPPQAIDDVPGVDVLFVLGGGSREHPQVGETGGSQSADRVLWAARIYHEGSEPLLIATGSSPDGAEDLAADTRRIWRQLAIPTDDMLDLKRLSQPTTTREEIAVIAEFVRQHDNDSDDPWHDIGILSSAWHLPRVAALCAAEGISERVVLIPADHRACMPAFSPRYLIPQGRGFAAIHLWSWETLGRLTGH